MFSKYLHLKSFSILLAILAFVSWSVAQKPNEQDIVVDSSIVILNAVVTAENGSVRRGLEKSDFELYENGVKQTIDFLEPETLPFAAVILIDVSGSMEYRVSLARSAAIRFLEGIRPNDQVSIFSFHSRIEMVQDFSNSKDLRSKVFDLEARGYTALNAAVLRASKVLEGREEKRRAIVVLSDGADTRSGVSASKALKAAQAANATIYTVDMSVMSSAATRRAQNQAVLKKFASKTGGIFVSTPGGAQLREAFANIVKDLGVQYTIGYHSSDQRLNGKWRDIELRLLQTGLEVRTRKGYYASRQ